MDEGIGATPGRPRLLAVGHHGPAMAVVFAAVLLGAGACDVGSASNELPRAGSRADPRNSSPYARETTLAGVLAPVLTRQQSGTTALLQAVSPVDGRVVWASGHDGAVVRTADGGTTWNEVAAPGPDSLQFRDVYAVDADVAYLLSAGPGELSRIYKTTDAGRSWTLQFLNGDPDAFFDCLDFWDADRGLAFSDAVGGEFIIIVTTDGGETWTRVPPERVPDAAPSGEGGFAASGTCLVTGPDGRAWIGTGVSPTARVLRTTDYGRTWTAAPTPIVGGEAAGIFSLAFRDTLHGVALGGDLDRPDAHTDNVAATADGGRTWTLTGRTHLPGVVYGAAYVPGAPTPTLVAVGPNGMDYSRDDAQSWLAADTLAYWAVGFAPPAAAGGRPGSAQDSALTGPPGTEAAPRAVGWAVGPDGRVVRISWR